MNDSVRDEIWVTVPVDPRVFVRTVELSELCLLMCPSPRCGQLPAWAQFWVDKVIPLTLHLVRKYRYRSLFVRKGAHQDRATWERS